MSKAGARFLDLISKRRGGLLLDIARGTLMVLSLPYMLAVTIRNAYYDLVKRSARRVGRPVIAIGNITVGGTGKTPMAAYVTNLLEERNRKTAILLRGYKGKPVRFDHDRGDRGLTQWRIESDEAMVLKRLCPRAAVIIDADRLAGARRAIAGGADAVVLDDAFQHRRIGRDLDVVLIDATLPFGHGHMLPRGLLREPVSSLRRADVIVLTRSDEVDVSTQGMLTVEIRRASGGKPVVHAAHRINGFVDIEGRVVENADGSAMRAVIFAGIANFESFRHSVEGLGVQVLAAYQYPDHHDYSAEEIAAFPDVAANVDANVLLTTEKDAVKLVGRWPSEGCRLLALRLEIAFDAEGAEVLTRAIDAVLTAR